MLEVEVNINREKEIVKVRAVNQQVKNNKGQTKYKLSTGQVVWHKREDGALELAKKMLDVVEPTG
jgi:hypothetical protein